MSEPTNILVVDDDPAVLRVLSSLLSAAGYKIRQAVDGHQALQMVRDWRPDLVLLDNRLPGLSGIEVCRQIKSDPSLPDIFVVMVSGAATSVADMVGAADIGADDYLIKPINAEELLARLRTLVRLHDTTAALRASDQHYRRLVEILPDAVGTIDLQGRLISVNLQTVRMLGYADADELLGRSIFDLTTQDDHERVRADMAATAETGLMRAVQYTMLKKDGRRFPVELSAAALRDSDDRLLGLVGVVRDFSAHKEAEEQIQLLADAVQSSRELICIADARNTFTFANRAFYQAYGYTASEVLGRTPQFLYSPNNPPGLYEEVYRGTLDGGWTGEVLNLRKDGTELPILLSTAQIKSKQGNILGLIGVATEISERKWTENLLELQRDFGIFLSSTGVLETATRQLLQTSLKYEGIEVGAVYLVDPRTDALSLSAYHGLSGEFAKRAPRASTNSAVTRGPATSTEPRGAAMADIVAELRREGLQVIEVFPIQHAGQVIAVLNVGSRTLREIPARSCQAIAAIAAQAGGAIARIRVEQSLRSSRELLERTLHSIHAAVIILDAETRTIQDCNPAASLCFGYRREEMLGMPVTALHEAPALFQAQAAGLIAAIGEANPAREFELTMLRKDGSRFPTEQSLSPLRDETGQISGWVGVIRDVTLRRQAEEELRYLSQRITEAQEAERLRVARELHDGVNQLIASAKMRLRRVEDSVASLNPAAREILARCYELLVQALEENRRIAHNLRPSDLDELGLAAACRNLCRELEARTGLSVVCHISRLRRRLLPEVELNLFRIVQEALTNVEKHARARSVQVRLAQDGDSVVLRIRDDGRGFGSKVSKSGRGKWQGIGLSNIRERARFMRGACEVKSTPHRGSTVTVRVPFKQDAQRPETGHPGH